jgi:hypothetical protein
MVLLFNIIALYINAFAHLCSNLFNLQNRTLYFGGPKNSLTASMTSSMLPKRLPRSLVLGFGNRQKSEANMGNGEDFPSRNQFKQPS